MIMEINFGFVLWERGFFLPLSLAGTTMLINGKPFEGTADYVVTDCLLKSCTGVSNMTYITQFAPVVFPLAQMVYKLLMALHKYNLCCFLTGAYAFLSRVYSTRLMG